MLRIDFVHPHPIVFSDYLCYNSFYKYEIEGEKVMAIWQVALDLVKNDDHIDFLSPTFIASLKKIEAILPETKSWCKTIKQYGELDSTCLEFDADDDSISVRIDLRNISKSQLQALCDFAKENDLFINYNDTLYESRIDTFLNIFRESRANKFLLDPEAFFKEISE